MSVSPSSLDLTIKSSPRIASSKERSIAPWLILSLATVFAAIAMPAIFDGWATAAGLGFVGMISGGAAAAIALSGSKPASTVVLVGRNAMASVVASALESSQIQDVRVFRAATVEEAAALIASNSCDEVILTEADSTELDFVDSQGHRPAIVSGPEAVERILGRIPMELVDADRWFGAMGAVRALAPGYVRAKRAIDFSIALGLAVATLPVMLIAALVIRFDSPGPVLFRQERRGLGGKPFEMIKFRSMRIAEERPKSDGDWASEVWTQQADPRITRVGRFLRASRIDELPQLLNILRGDMTFVGPRPEPTHSAAVLEELLPAYPKRYAVQPGLTGWAQVCYGYTNSVDGQRRKVEYDLYYVKHASLRLDLRIMARTAMVILRLKGL
jgi:lipopolysaccharide/colanic/teichoic acid biosynthesis glycosyltransferase